MASPSESLRSCTTLGRAMAVEERFLEANGLRTRVLHAGEGKTVLVLLHGAEADADMWAPYMEGLARGRRVLAPDLPGHGGSASPDDMDCSPPGVALWLAGLLDAEGVVSAALLGHSFGGVVAMAVALEVPDRVDRLVGVNVANLDWATRTFRDGAYALMKALARDDLEEQTLREILTMIYDRDPASVEITEGAAFWSRPGVRAFFSRGGALFSGSTPAWRLRELAVPTLLIWGARDRFFPLESVRTGVMYIPNSRLLIIEDGTHSPFVDAPDLFYLAVDGFLSAGPAAGSP
jgi:2-hydroxy-6-oxonona-2,4-dienedioate hydrolase